VPSGESCPFPYDSNCSSTPWPSCREARETFIISWRLYHPSKLCQLQCCEASGVGSVSPWRWSWYFCICNKYIRVLSSWQTETHSLLYDCDGPRDIMRLPVLSNPWQSYCGIENWPCQVIKWHTSHELLTHTSRWHRQVIHPFSCNILLPTQYQYLSIVPSRGAFPQVAPMPLWTSRRTELHLIKWECTLSTLFSALHGAPKRKT